MTIMIVIVLGIAVIGLINAEKIMRWFKRWRNGWQNDGRCGHDIPEKEFGISGMQACLFLSAKCPICNGYLHKFLVNEWESNNEAKWHLPKKGTAPEEVIRSVEGLMRGLIKQNEPLGRLFIVSEKGVPVQVK